MALSWRNVLFREGSPAVDLPLTQTEMLTVVTHPEDRLEQGLMGSWIKLDHEDGSFFPRTDLQ